MNSVRNTIQHNGRDDDRNSGKQQKRIPLRIDKIIPDDADNQRQSHADGKSHTKTGYGHRAYHKDVRYAVNNASQESECDIGPAGCRKIRPEGPSITSIEPKVNPATIE